MGAIFAALIILLILLAVFTQEPFVFTILYLLAGINILSRLWSNYSLKHIGFRRDFSHRAFPHEVIPVKLEVENQSWLPVVWLNVQDLLPIEISLHHSFQQVITLAPRERYTVEYELNTNKRGIYPVGPLRATTGDLLGIVNEKSVEGLTEQLIVYPKVVPLTELGLPSRSPLGTLRHTLPIYEDPTRSVGKRDYQRGDSLRRIDWKSSAASGKLQVKQFEPSIALESMIFLNMNLEEYYYKSRFQSSEVAVVTAASIANYIISEKQTVGLISNGSDPLGKDNVISPVKPDKGRPHLMRILETLARIKSVETNSILPVLRQYRPQMSWGSTVILITGSVDETLYDELFQFQRRGCEVVLVLCGPVMEFQQVRKRAEGFGMVVYGIAAETDLEVWRK